MPKGPKGEKRPSNPRDGIGILVDTFLDPLTYVASNNDAEEYLIIRTAVSLLFNRPYGLEVGLSLV